MEILVSEYNFKYRPRNWYSNKLEKNIESFYRSGDLKSIEGKVHLNRDLYLECFRQALFDLNALESLKLIDSSLGVICKYSKDKDIKNLLLVENSFKLPNFKDLENSLQYKEYLKYYNHINYNTLPALDSLDVAKFIEEFHNLVDLITSKKTVIKYEGNIDLYLVCLWKDIHIMDTYYQIYNYIENKEIIRFFEMFITLPIGVARNLVICILINHILYALRFSINQKEIQASISDIIDCRKHMEDFTKFPSLFLNSYLNHELIYTFIHYLGQDLWLNTVLQEIRFTKSNFNLRKYNLPIVLYKTDIAILLEEKPDLLSMDYYKNTYGFCNKIINKEKNCSKLK